MKGFCCQHTSDRLALCCHYYIGLWHGHIFVRMRRFLLTFGYDQYFMFSFFKFLHEKIAFKDCKRTFFNFNYYTFSFISYSRP